MKKFKVKNNIDNSKKIILTPCNVMAMGKFIKKDEKYFEGSLNDFTLMFRIVGDGDLNSNIKYSGDMEYFILKDGSKYSRKYLLKANKIRNEFIGSSYFYLYQVYNIKKKCFEKDNPCLLRSDDLCFVIAPRIEHD